jgi:hypothetical protein
LKPSLPTASGPDRRHRGGFYFFEKNLCREPLAKAVGKGGFSIFFENSPVPSVRGRSRRQRWFFYFFLKIILCRVSGPEAVGKDGFLFFKKISLPSAFGNYSRQS